MVHLGPKWKNPDLTLGERCIAFSENEMNNNVKEDKFNSFTSSRIKEYLAPCTRLVNGKEIKLGLIAGNWCAAAGCFAMRESLLTNEVAPHGYHAGVVEVVADMEHNKIYFSIERVRQGIYKPKVGDVVVFDRSTPGKPETSWYRHFARVYSIDDEKYSFKCISGNSGGKWKISYHNLSQASLLGFGSYPTKIAPTSINPNPLPIQPFENKELKDLAPLEDSGKFISQGIFDKFFNLFGNKS